MKHYVLVGFANSGKSTLFNRMAGANQKTGNWTGVTVASKRGQFSLAGETADLVDLPGLGSLNPRQAESQDRAISRAYLAANKLDGIINVIDATQLQRQLFLTQQLLELGVPVLVVVNKVDRLNEHGIDLAKLETLLGCPAIGINSLDKAAAKRVTAGLAQLQGPASPLQLELTDEVDQHLQQDHQSLLQLEQSLSQQACECQGQPELLKDILLARYTKAQQIAEQVTADHSHVSHISDRIDKVILHPVAGVPVFLAMMYLLFMFAINVGGAFIDFFDILGGALFVDYPLSWLAPLNLPMWLLTLIEGVGSGLQTVVTFIPIIACLFVGLTILESSGYLARAAFVVDGVMQRIGLPGKAFVPLIVGFGCTVPAVMAARVMDSERERITTVMMSPFMSCGARLPVYALFAAAFFPESGQNLVFLLYLIGIAAAVFTGLLLKHTVLPGKSSLSIMELPLYEMPSLARVGKRVWQRTMTFVTGAGQTIVIVVCILNFFNSLGTDGQFGHHDSEGSVLSKTSQVITPLLSPMGVEEDNWQAGVGIITGLFAKEALVATFNSLYSNPEEDGGEPGSLSDVWSEAVSSIGEGMQAIEADDPMNVGVGNVGDLAAAAEEQEVNVSTFAAMQQAFSGKLGAFSYLLFILLYTPCAAAMGAIKNEVGNKWAAFAALWSFGLAYLSATLCYQLGSITVEPLQASIYIALVLLSFTAIYLWLKRRGQQILTIPTTVSYR